MFELEKTKAKLVKPNPRVELHGEDKKPALDLIFEAEVSNDVLSFFDPKLKAALYKKGDSAQQELIKDAGYLPLLKFPELGQIKWDYVGSGYSLQVHYGIDGKSDIKLTDLQVDKIKLTCKEGGRVLMNFRVICHPCDADSGRLNGMVGQIVEITLTPPEDEEQQRAA
jgi:hypothetical protein